MLPEIHEPVTRRPADELIRDKHCLAAARDFVRISQNHLSTMTSQYYQMENFAPALAFRQASSAFSLQARRLFIAGSAALLVAGGDFVMNGQENSAEQNLGEMAVVAFGLRTALRGRRDQMINQNLVDWAHDHAGPRGFMPLVERVQQEINRQSPGLRHRP